MTTRSKLFSVASITVLGCLLTVRSATAVITVAEWTFESSTPVDTNNIAVYPFPISADIGAGNAGATHAAAGTDYSAVQGNGSDNAFNVNNWAADDYFQFQVNLGSYSDILVAWDQTKSATGPENFKLQYSTDGSGFTDFGSYVVLSNATVNGGVWNSSTLITNYHFSYDLTSVSALGKEPAVYFRLTSLEAGSSAAGTVRVDNFLVQALTIPEPSTLVLLVGGFFFLHRTVRRKNWRRGSGALHRHTAVTTLG
ncbi:hypothetical protein HQ590_11395 [bacterium]|nr:hypothetical protein [bacterium]